METYDPQLEQRVWNRLRGETAPKAPADDIPALIANAAQAAAIYRSLALRVPPQHRQTLLQMARQMENHQNTLSGIHHMATGHPRPLPPLPAQRQMPLSATLRRSYSHALKLFSAFESRTHTPEYGPVFRQMAQETGNHLGRILQILGQLS